MATPVSPLLGGAEMTFHPKGLMALAAFAVILLLALNSSIVPVVIAAGIVLEVLLWRGVFGFGRSARSDQSR